MARSRRLHVERLGCRVTGARLNQRAPDIDLPSHTGERFVLASLEGRAACIIVYFFPAAYTPACTAEACAFRDAENAIPQLAALSSATIPEPPGGSALHICGISSNSTSTLAGFARRFRIQFALLSDEGGPVRRAWNVPRTWGIFPGRVTYVLDSGLIVREIIESQWRPALHARRSLAAATRIMKADATAR